MSPLFPLGRSKCIKTLYLHNIQSYSDATIELGIITRLHGLNSSGKSAIRKGFEALFSLKYKKKNEQKEFIRQGTSQAIFGVQQFNGVCIYVYVGTYTGYCIIDKDGQEWFTQINPPYKVIDYLGYLVVNDNSIDDYISLNIRTKRTFFVETPSRVNAEMLDIAINDKSIDKALYILQDDFTIVSDKVDKLKVQIDNINHELSLIPKQDEDILKARLQYIQKLKRRATYLNELSKSLKLIPDIMPNISYISSDLNISLKMNELSTLYVIYNCICNIQPPLIVSYSTDDINSDLEVIDVLDCIQDVVCKMITFSYSIIEIIQNCKDRVELNNGLFRQTSSMAHLNNRINTLNNMLDLEKLLSKLCGTLSQVIELSNDIADTSNYIEQLEQTLKVCPLCKKPFK